MDGFHEGRREKFLPNHGGRKYWKNTYEVVVYMFPCLILRIYIYRYMMCTYCEVNIYQIYIISVKSYHSDIIWLHFNKGTLNLAKDQIYPS